ncbi:hypothetical protein I4U23_005508 [Adineta vaga]|nr:hypothetical protein I4U23_005508 [Adineta vaga]
MEKDSYYAERYPSSLIELKNLQWSNTVQLSLIVQFPFEILFILRKSAIPYLEYLYITIEQEQLNTKSYSDKLSIELQFCENHIRQMTDASRLQTLILRHLSHDKVTILIRSLNMPLLKKLILVEIFDETLRHYEELRQIVNNEYLPYLKELYFLIYFPENLYQEFQKNIINRLDMIWPFHNLAYHIEDQLVCSYNVYQKTKQVILFYTFSLDILLKYTRTIHNHSFAQYSKPINRHCIRWMCNQIDNLIQLTNTFNTLATDYVDIFVLEFYQMQRFLQNDESMSSWSRMRFPWLRSVIFNFEYNVMKQSDCVYIIDQILRSSPRLQKLTVEWEDLRLCSSSNRNIKHLSLLVNERCQDPTEYINIDYLFQLLPNISCLEIGRIDLLFNEDFVKFIVKIVDTIIKLVQLVLNKNGLIPIDPEIPILIQQEIFNTGNKRLFNSHICQITFPRRNELRI